MPKIEKINCETINTNGTSFQGDLYASYNDIVSKLGEPLTEKLCYKSDAEWIIEFEDGTVATIYNWKDGKSYCGERGMPTESITEWHIGGSIKRVEEWVNDYIHNSWPVFDEIRQEAQF